MTESDSATRRVMIDQMCGKLPVYLRICGWDAAYTGDRGLERDAVIRRLAAMEDRRVISRDRDLVRSADRGQLLESQAVEGQLGELVAAGAALGVDDPPTRCGRCNGRLVAGPSDIARPSYAPADTSVRCWRCRRCDQYFWRGSHWERMRRTLDRVVSG